MNGYRKMLANGGTKKWGDSKGLRNKMFTIGPNG